jgi:hypothetical protein
MGCPGFLCGLCQGTGLELLEISGKVLFELDLGLARGFGLEIAIAPYQESTALSDVDKLCCLALKRKRDRPTQKPPC